VADLQVVSTRAQLAAARAKLAGTVGLVPTMGALHRGHRALIEAAKAGCDSVLVSIFVNPMQFDQAADLDRYPRPIEADLALCEELGVEVVWKPSVETMYPQGPARVWVTAGALADQLEGPHRPGHFDGVLTVVTKLLSAVRPDRAYFGEKDYQQLTLVRQLVIDLALEAGIELVPTVREPDGLALSSRNVFLSSVERQRALALIGALRAGRAAAEIAADAAGVAQAAWAALDRSLGAGEGVDVEYLELRDPALGPPPPYGPARLLIAARIGRTRLIDNIGLELLAAKGAAGPASDPADTAAEPRR
jgi:pantoate--beta-alanine ligase